MEIQKRSSMNVASSLKSNSYLISDTVDSSQQKKRKQSSENSSSLVLLPADSRQKTKKKSKVKCATSKWLVSPITEGGVFESDSSDSNVKGLYFVGDIPAIYASSVNERSNSNNESISRAFTQENFEELMERADLSSDSDSSESEDTFYQKMENKLSKELEKKPPKKKKKIVKIEKADRVRVHPVFSKNSMVLLMDHPASATLYRYVSVQVISGSVSLSGYQLNSHSPPLRVFSSNISGLLEIKTLSCGDMWKTKEDFQSASAELRKVVHSNKMMREIMQNSSNSSVMIILEGCVLPPRLQFVELYYPFVFKFNVTDNFKKKFRSIQYPRKTYCLPCSDTTIQFNTEAEDLADDVVAAIKSSKMKESDGPRILVYGPKNTGKSSLLRFLMNRALSLFSDVFFLDADPGQTEFTPPGVVSLTKVAKPILGPPFAHQRKSVAMTFTGAVSADSSPDMYCKSVAKMAHIFQNSLSDETLFVNTMGWVKGIGLECLKNVIRAVRPTILIEIIAEEDDSMFDYRECLTNKIRFYQIQRPFPKRLPTDLGAEKERSLCLLSYLGRNQMPHEKPKYLNSFKPVCISYDNIPIYVFGKSVPRYRLVEAINASFVALCKVDKSLILESTIPTIPKTLQEEPDNECIGFGMVRAIDESKHLLYIITPLSVKELKDVNAIIKGNVMIPPSVFLKQPILGVPLPFTDESIIVPPEKETENQDNIAKNYRKSIAKRYGKKKQNK